MSPRQIQSGLKAKAQHDVPSVSGRAAESPNPSYIRAHTCLIDTIDALGHLKSSNEHCSMSHFDELYELIRRVGEFAPNPLFQHLGNDETKMLREQLDTEKSKCSDLELQLEKAMCEKEALMEDVNGLQKGLKNASAIGQKMIEGVMANCSSFRGSMLGIQVAVGPLGDTAFSRTKDVGNGQAGHFGHDTARNDHRSTKSPKDGSLDRETPEKGKPKKSKRRLVEAFGETFEVSSSDDLFGNYESGETMHNTDSKRRRVGSTVSEDSRVHFTNGELGNTAETIMAAPQVDGVIDLPSPHMTKTDTLSAKHGAGTTTNAESSSGYRDLRPHRSSTRSVIGSSDPQALTKALHTIVEEAHQSPAASSSLHEEDDIDSMASTQILDEIRRSVLPRPSREPTTSDDEASDKENSPPEYMPGIIDAAEANINSRGASEDRDDEAISTASDPTPLRRNWTPERQFGDVLAVNDVRSPDPPTPVANDHPDARVKTEPLDDEGHVSVIIDDSEDEAGGKP